MDPYQPGARADSVTLTNCGMSVMKFFTGLFLHEARHAYQYKLITTAGNNSDADGLPKSVAVSPVDIIVDSIDGQPLGLFRLARISDALERLLARPVDLISRSGLNHARRLKQQVTGDLVDVF